MPIKEVSQLDKAGLITDISEYLLAPEAFSVAYNVEFSNGEVRASKGYTKYPAYHIYHKHSYQL